MLETIFRIFTWPNTVFLLQGARMTLVLSLIGIMAGLGIGLIGGVIRTCEITVFKLIKPIVILYTEVFRRVPLIVLLLLSYFLTGVFDVEVSTFGIAAIGIVVYAGAYMIENMRAGIEAIPKTQWEAGKGIGLTNAQLYRYVILPQGLRISIPASLSFMQSLVKDTSMAVIIGLLEITRVGIILRFKEPMGSFWIFFAIMILYFIICWPLQKLGDILERRVRKYAS